MKTFIVTVERTVVYTDKYEVEAQDEEQAVEIVQEGDLDSIFQDCEEVDAQFDAEELS